MTNPTEDLLARARAALEGVTPGPWIVNQEGWAVISSGSDSVLHGYVDTTCDDCGAEVKDRADVAISIEDAEFIAAARQLIPELADRLEFMEHEFEAERDRADKHFDAWIDAECSVTALKKTVERVRKLAEVAEQHGGQLWAGRIRACLDGTET